MKRFVALAALLPTVVFGAPDRYGISETPPAPQAKRAASSPPSWQPVSMPKPAVEPLTVEQKKEQLTPKPAAGAGLGLSDLNQQLRCYQQQLVELNGRAQQMHQQGASEDEYQQLVLQIRDVRQQMAQAEDAWRRANVGESTEGYSLWQQPETTIGQLVVDYGAQEYAYLIPPDVGALRVTISSNIPIPREAWGDMLGQILTQNGVGVRQLNPFLRQLYLMKETRAGMRVITSRREELEAAAPQERVGYVLVPAGPDTQGIGQLLEKFVNPQVTQLVPIGRAILLVGPAQETAELLKVYDFVAASYGHREYRIVPLNKANPKDMEAILSAIFAQADSEKKDGVSSLRIMTLEQAKGSLFLLGSAQDVRDAERIIREVEGQLDDPKERVIYWYTCRHSDPNEVAQALSDVYQLLSVRGAKVAGSEQAAVAATNGEPAGTEAVPATSVLVPSVETMQRAIFGPPYQQPYESAFGPGSQLVVSPTKLTGPTTSNAFQSFVVDPKTSSIIMVVEQESLPQLKKLLKKLDAPPKMVRIDVLLFEKKVTDQVDIGLNLLRIGQDALNIKTTGLNFNNVTAADPVTNAGILQFFMSRPKRADGTPAIDFSYKFLMTQRDITINSSPSVTTMNQTPAIINIVDQISINTGTVIVGTGADSTRQQSFVRAEYGTIIEVTPTINAPALEDLDADELDLVNPRGEVTLDTTVTFDTVAPGNDPDRPDITRRNIKNHVRVGDGETVILGGLRRKSTNDFSEKIPFLGEIPGLGKLFSNNTMKDESTEMFIFLTPRIISDPCCEMEMFRRLEMIWRPGDLPEYLCNLEQALHDEQTRFLAQGIQMVLGRPTPGCMPWTD